MTERQAGKAIVVAIAGRLDVRTVDEFRDRLLPRVSAAAARGDAVVLDFSDVEQISSAAELVLMQALKETTAAGTKMVLASLQPLVKEIFEISRFNEVFPCYADVNEALAALAAGGKDAGPG